MGMFSTPYQRIGSSGSSSGLFSRPATPSIPAGHPLENAGKPSVGGFLGNVLGDLKEIGLGLGQLGVNVAKDAVGETAEALSFGAYDHSSSIDDIVKALPAAIGGDYKKRYGSGLDQALQSAYEDPLALLGDVLTVATAGGYGAAKGAQLASKVPAVADDLARLSAGAVDDVGRTARVADKVLPGLKEGPGAWAGGTRTQVDEIGNLVEKERAFNPVRRALVEPLRDRITTAPLEKTERTLAALKAIDEVGELPTPLKNRIPLLEEKLGKARSSDLGRLPRESFVKAKQGLGKSQLQQLTRRVLGETGTSHVQQREIWTSRYRDILTRVPKDMADDFHLRLQGVKPTQVQAPRLGFDDITRALGDEEFLASSPRARHIAEVVQPHLTDISRIDDPLELEKARRVIEQVAGEPLAAIRSGVTDEAADVIDDIRLTNFEHEASALLRSGAGYGTLFDRALAPLRVAEAKTRGLKSIDEAADSLMIDDAIKSTGAKAPVYFPHRSTLTLKTSSFVMPYRTSGMRTAALPRSFKKSEQVLFRDFLDGQKDAYQTDPLEAYSRLAAEVVRHEETLRFVDRIKSEFGRTVTARDQLADGEVLMNPDFVRVILRSRQKGIQAMDDALESGLDQDQAFLKGLEQSMDEFAAEVPSVGKGELYAVPQIVADELYKVTKHNLGGSKARIFWDGPVNMWRNINLYTRPAYFMNNVFGNTAFLKLQGGKVTGMLRQMSKKHARTLQDVIPYEVRGEIEHGFYSTASQRSTYLSTDTKLGEAVALAKGSAPGRAATKTRETLQGLNGFFEDAARRESFITAAERDLARRNVRLAGTSLLRSKKRIERMMKTGADEGLYTKWLDDMQDTMNNYASTSPFERKVLIRFVAPFWTFYKHAAKTLIKLPIAHPAKARVLDWVHETTKEIDQDLLGDLPEWLESFVAIGEGTEGETRFASTKGANPVAGVLESPTSLLNPFIQTVLEQTTGRDTFTGKQFQDPDVYNDPITGMQLRLDENGIPQPIEGRLGGALAAVAPGPLETLAQMVPFVDLYRDLRSGGARYNAVDEVIEEAPGVAKYPTDPLQELLRYLGISTIDFDVTNYQDNLDKARKRAGSVLSNRP
jgi:hypothetical protein